MAAKAFFTLTVSVLFLMSCNVLGFPNSGINVCNITTQNKSCGLITHAMYSGGLVFLEITLHEDLADTLEYSVYKQCPIGAQNDVCSNNFKFNESKNSVWIITEAMEDNCKLSTNLSESERGTVKGVFDVFDANASQAVMQFVEDGLYIVEVHASNPNIKSGQKKRSDDKNVGSGTLLEVRVIMKNPLGYLDAADYPYLVFYSLMFVGYFFLGIIWSVCMCCSCKDLIRLQLFIGVAIIMGFAEKLFFVAEYGYVNTTGSRYTDTIIPFIIIAEGISAGKKTFARVLLIIISSGFGTVRPRLGSLLWKVLLFGLVFFVATLIDGFVRAYYYHTLEGFSKEPLITGVIQVVLDTLLLYWIISNLIDTRRTLRLRKNYKKLAFYNHLLVTFVIVAISVLAFLLWIFITGLVDPCTQDWKGFWLRECFWPLLFTLLLVVIMILWRPSSNAVRFAYSAVSNEDEEEIQQKANENFETMKMRHGSKSDVMPPKPSAETEEDLKWVEENLPASTIDRVLQPLMDSDEELMTTRFERSKMD